MTNSCLFFPRNIWTAFLDWEAWRTRSGQTGFKNIFSAVAHWVVVGALLFCFVLFESQLGDILFEYFLFFLAKLFSTYVPPFCTPNLGLKTIKSRDLVIGMPQV